MARAHRTLLLLLLSLTATTHAHAETVTVAVASNFADTARVLANDYEQTTGHEVRIVQGSTGKLHAQIVNGAPFDVFLSADVERAEGLPAEDAARFTYAIGRLVVWSGDPSLEDGDCLEALTDADSSRVAIANPALAPYGRAAKEFLESRGLWEQVRPRLVYGENVAQALQFAATGNARIAFVAESQLGNEALPATGCAFRVPGNGDTVLEQQAVLLPRAADSEAAVSFFNFLRSPGARATIEARGYGLPEDS